MSYKLVKILERKYYKYVYEPWSQPILSANGAVGGNSFAVLASQEQQSSNPQAPYKAFQAFDNDSNTYWRSGTTTGWLEFYNPVKLKVTNLRWGFFYSTPTSGTVQASDDGTLWTTLTTWTNSISGDFNIDLSSNTQAYKYYRLNIDSINMDIIHCAELTITATQQAVAEGTSSDYDFYEDIPVYKLKKTPGEIIYLKNFANPGNMTSNGTLGGNTFAVEGTPKSSGNNLYQIMGDNIDWTKLYEHRQNSGYITFYNPIPFKLEKFTVQVNGNAPSINCVMYGSNDNTNWTQVASRPTSSGTAVPDVWTINSPDFYKYYKYTYDATNYYSQGKATLIYYLHVSGYTEGTAQDYDAVLDTTKYELTSEFNKNYRLLEYVEADGTQAVNLGVTVGTSKMEANIDAQITNIPNSTYTGWFLTFGTGLGGPGEGIGLGIRKESSSSSTQYSCIEPGVNWNKFSTATLDRTRFKWVINGNNSVVSGYASNNVTASNIFGNSCQWRNENRTTVAGHLQDSTYIDLLSCKYYALDILLDDNKVRDLIPVERKSDGVGGLYDKVTNTFYRSVLSDFIKGPYV